MAELEGGTWGNILLGLATLGTALGWAREKYIKTRVESAEAGAQVALAGSQESMFNMLSSRLDAQDAEIRALRDELRVERDRSRRMEKHIYKLEAMLTQLGQTPPVFEG